MHEDEKLPFTSHLEELRKRLITGFIAIGVGFVVSFGFKERLFGILVQPLIRVMKDGETLIYTGLPEAFFTYLKVSFLSGLIVASPILLYQFWMFVAPGLYQKERRLMVPIVILSSFFFIGGALFGYFVVFPWGFKFFMGFATETIRPLPSMKEYFGFSAKLLLAFGLVFELPLVLTFMAKLGIVSVDFLKKNRKYALLLFFAGAAILTPPDVITQVLMAMPLMVLYEISIIGAKIFGKKKPEENKSKDAEKSAA
ncbi:MAG: twin-arginine translocase subunit TatC [Deltaproteobacteria bacterium]|jgi:sec-independent protein translocase protein TatC|nr:twin-arginine translocase subunit TatC [Deltaproteobacteria bacterium]